MSFRRRMTLLVAGAVAGAVILSAVAVYVVTRNKLIDQLDASLREKPTTVGLVSGPHGGGSSRSTPVRIKQGTSQNAGAAEGGGVLSRSERVTAPSGHAGAGATETVTVERKTVVVPAGTIAAGSEGSAVRDSPQASLGGPKSIELPREISEGATGLALPRQALGGATGYVQLYTSRGQLLRTENRGLLLPVTAATRAVASGTRDAFFSDVTVAGTRVRMFTEAAGAGAVWQAALPLADLDSTLSRLRVVLGLVCLCAIALAAALGLIVSRAALGPVRRLTGAAERVARTQDLSHRIEDRGTDEVGRLAGSFNTMLAALEESRLAQRRLVSDASHELRTPLTSIRANLDALAEGDRLAPSERARAVAAVQAQLSELTVLVGDLVDLSKTDTEDLEVEHVRLDLAAAAAVQRARLHAPDCRFTLEAEPCLIRAAPGRLDRAIANLLDNACQWSGASGQPIEVLVKNGTLTVRDHGPGISPEDLPRVFDRFYRSSAARRLPGSGLGLAIVRQVAESSGGSVEAGNDPGGGACLTLQLPSMAMNAEDLDPGAVPDRGSVLIPAAGPLHDPPRSL